MKEYIERNSLMKKVYTGMNIIEAMQAIIDEPAADVVEEENILKFYYVRSIDEYWIGQRIDNFYYAEYDSKRCQWVWTHSRHLPWGEHIVSPTSLWKEHTYPSEPEEIPFAEWLQGFIKKHSADVVEVRHGKWIEENTRLRSSQFCCSVCHRTAYDPQPTRLKDWKKRCRYAYCPNCGARMDGGVE